MKTALGAKVEKLDDSKPKSVGNNNSTYKSVYDEPYSPGKVYPPVTTAKTTGTATADMANKLLNQPTAPEGQPIVAPTRTVTTINSPDDRTAGAGVPSYNKFPNVLNRSKVSPEEVLSRDANDAVMPAAGMASVGDSFVQLGSVRTQADAEEQWQKLQKASGTLLSSVSPRFVPANIDGQGQFVRIQAGPLSDTEASALCQSLNAKSSGSCLVVR